MTELLERPAAAPVTRPRRSRARRPLLITGAVATVAMLAYMVYPYLPPDIASSRIPVNGDAVHFWLLWGHIAFATIATVTGLVQFWPALRRKYPVAHRWTGRAYFFLGIFPSTVLAVPVALMSEQGVANMAGLLALIALWTWTGVQGYVTVRRRQYAEHRKWMIRNYAMTLASLASRVWTLLLTAWVVAEAGSPMYQGNETAMFHDVASASVWLAIIANLVIAEGYIQRRYGRNRRSAG